MSGQQLVRSPSGAPVNEPRVVAYNLSTAFEDGTLKLRGSVTIFLPAHLQPQTVVLRALAKFESGRLGSWDANLFLPAAGQTTDDQEWWFDHNEAIESLRFSVGVTTQINVDPRNPLPTDPCVLHGGELFLEPHGGDERRQLDIFADIENRGGTIEGASLRVEYVDGNDQTLNWSYAVGDPLPPGRTSLHFMGSWDADDRAKHGIAAWARVTAIELEQTHWWNEPASASQPAPTAPRRGPPPPPPQPGAPAAPTRAGPPPPPPQQPGFHSGQSPAGVDLDAMANATPDEMMAMLDKMADGLG